MPYTPYYIGGWQNQPSVVTPILAAALNTIDNGIRYAGAAGWYGVVAYGADPTGAADSTTAIQNAINAAVAAGGGTVYFPAGTYKVSSTLSINIAGVTLQGDGIWVTVIKYTGSSDCIRMFSTTQYTSGFGGGVKGLMVDGTSAAAGAAGIHAGDIYQLQWDCGVRFFQGAGSKNFWFDNNYWFAEDMYGHIFAQQGTSNVVFDNSANLGGGHATGSFDRAMLTIVLDCKGVGNGLVWQGGAFQLGGELNVQGNMDYAPSGGPYYVATLGSSPNSKLSQVHLNWDVECNATVGTQPGTINFTNASLLSACISQCAGELDFSGNNPFRTNSTNWNGNFLFDGPVYGDGNLKSCSPLGRAGYSVGAIITGQTIETRFNAVATVAPASNVTGIIMARDFTANWREITIVNESNFTLTFDVPGTSFVADGTSDVIAALAAARYVWDFNTSLWYRVK